MGVDARYIYWCYLTCAEGLDAPDLLRLIPALYKHRFAAELKLRIISEIHLKVMCKFRAFSRDYLSPA